MNKFCAFCFLFIFNFSLISLGKENPDTRYPIVLVHGLFGYGGKLGYWLRYWSDIPDLLRQNGITVYVAHVSQAHKISKRGKQLYHQLQQWGHEKYNLIGHSHGGLDARYVMENFPDIVASVTTIGTPNRGSKVADALGFDSNRRSAKTRIFARFLGDIVGHTISFLSGVILRQNTVKAINGLTTDALKRFNAKYRAGIGSGTCDDGPDEHNGIKLYSWGSHGVTPASRLDIFSRIMRFSSNAFDEDEQNDGLVAVCSMKFGKWLGVLPGSHHLVPILGIFAPLSEEQREWSTGMFFSHAKRLRKAGL